MAGTAQVPSAGTWYSMPTEPEVTQFLAQGWRLFGPGDVRELLAQYGIGVGSGGMGNE